MDWYTWLPEFGSSGSQRAEQPQSCIQPSDLWHARDDQRAPLGRRLPSHFGRRLCQLANGRLCNRIQSIRETAALWATKTQILSSAIISDIMWSVSTGSLSVYKCAAVRACLTQAASQCRASSAEWKVQNSLPESGLPLTSDRTTAFFSFTSTLDGDRRGDSPERSPEENVRT